MQVKIEIISDKGTLANEITQIILDVLDKNEIKWCFTNFFSRTTTIDKAQVLITLKKARKKRTPAKKQMMVVPNNLRGPIDVHPTRNNF